MPRVAAFACWLLLVASRGHAETVALLPLDGEKRLDIYGQPVAAEIARALQAAGIDVVVVGARMQVPDRAQLIVDGTIKAGKADAITLSIRIRDPRDGTVLETLPVASAALADIDRAAADLSARVVPSVRTQLSVVTAPRPAQPRPPAEVRPPQLPPQPKRPVLVFAVSAPTTASDAVLLLRAGLEGEVAEWSQAHGRDAKAIDAMDLANDKRAPAIVGEHATDLGIALHVLSFAITPGKVPLARARVRFRVIGRDRVELDRVIVTDTIVGDRTITPEQFGARAARAVLAIAHPNVRRAIATWR